MLRRGPVLLFLFALVTTAFPGSSARAAASISPVAQDRSVDPVVLSGQQFPGWSGSTQNGTADFADPQACVGAIAINFQAEPFGQLFLEAAGPTGFDTTGAPGTGASRDVKRTVITSPSRTT